MGHVPGLNLRRTSQITPSLTAESYEVSPKDGDAFVRVKFEHRIKDGTVREFTTDLARLEFIEKRAAEYAASGSRETTYEQVDDVHVFFKRGDYEGRGEAVGVQLVQKHPDDPREWERLATFSDNFTTAVKEGQIHERELGHDKRWHVLVDASSLTKDENGRIQAQAVTSFDSETKAREHLGKSTGLALYLESQRREFSKGESIELRADAALRVKGETYARSVESQLERAEFSRGRTSELHVVARWYDASRAPVIGQRVTWQGTGQAYNGEPEDFRAGPLRGWEHGEGNKPVWVLIEKDPRTPGRGTIVGLSEERKVMTAELVRQDVMHQAVTRDRNQQSFGPDPKQHKQEEFLKQQQSLKQQEYQM